MSNIEDHIHQAMQDGKFDDLPGKGKPLNLDDNPLADPEWRMAHHMLRSSGFTLPWIEKRQEIDAGLEQARQDLQRAWDWHSQAARKGLPPAQAEREWQRALERFQAQVAEINKKLFSYNLEVPSGQFQRLPVSFKHEVETLTQGNAE
jgi:DnaJ family protein C protein 28